MGFFDLTPADAFAGADLVFVFEDFDFAEADLLELLDDAAVLDDLPAVEEADVFDDLDEAAVFESALFVCLTPALAVLSAAGF